MPTTGPRNFPYNLRSVDEAQEVEEDHQIEPIAEEEIVEDMASGMSLFRLEKFRGDGTDDITDFLKKFDRYVNLCNIKAEQQFDLLCLQLEGRAQWYIDSLHTAPADLAALKNVLTNKFKRDERIKMDIFRMKKLDIESINDFVYRVEKETHKLDLTDQLKVQIAIGGLHPSIQSAISSHGPKP